MLHKKRKARRHNTSKRLLGRVILIGVLLISIVGGAALYVLKTEKPSILSPLAHGVLGLSSLNEDPRLDQLRRLLTEQHIRYTSATNTDGQYTVTLDTKTLVLFSSQKDFASQISSLQFILTRLTMEGRQVRKLDLRFDKPVILF